MGVPKFYRWISERYPCLSETVKEFQIPEFDNLYLDMNGIIHVCSHPEDDNPHFRITEEKIFADIMYYLEFLFRMIKPRKVFFMAVDGVAPRAKMNQQRGRRFRSAREAEVLENKARDRGEVLPTEKRFDSNCITPGTPFMARLQEQLKYFVVRKVSTDPLWHGVRVYLSGHETPGEGEHKIMDFIRAERLQPGYDPNTRHCLYGLDADLMMLGLATHEPHFSLLREEVRFGGRKDKNKRPATPEETTFHLLHLSLFREYLDFEFSALKDKELGFPYDLEAVIDDWVMMGFLVGNDFIPHLPNLHINHDALPLLWQTYIEVLPSCGGYINKSGYLNLERFEKYLTALSKFDFDTFSEQAGDLKWLEGKKAAGGAERQELLSAARKFRKNVKKDKNQFAALSSIDDMDAIDDISDEILESEEDISEDITVSDDDSTDDTLDDEFRHHKRNYYMTKMEYEKVTPEVLRDQAEGYVRGIQWILLYYYEGVPSWSWFYPHHYAPYMSDVKDFKDMEIKFDLAKPFMPFEQLMAVLPAASKELLPKAFQTLMTTDSSPVIDFYPDKFDTDLNGKQQDWEAVVLIPFIDEKRLLDAMRTSEYLMTDEEKSRNIHGPCLLYQYTSESQGVYQSPIPGVFPDVSFNHSKLTEEPIDAFWIRSEDLVHGILPGAQLDVFYPGFPTLKHIKHRAELSKEQVKVFQMNSRGYNMMLHVEEEGDREIEQVAKEYLGKEIYVGWPHLYEAKVIRVCNDAESFNCVETQGKGGKSQKTSPRMQVQREEMDENAANVLAREATTIAERYKERLGVVVGPIDIVVKALPMTGRKYMFGSHGRVTTEKQFGTHPVSFALQTTVKDIAVHNPDECPYKSLQEYLPEKATVFMMGWPHYGCQGEVIEVDNTENGRVRINITIIEEPNVARIMNNQQSHTERYTPIHIAAQRLGVSTNFLNRITGTVRVHPKGSDQPVDVGLNLKFTKRQEEAPGYTKMFDGRWGYSEKAIDIVTQYMQKFPEMFDAICNSVKHNDNFGEDEVIPGDCGYKIQDVTNYIKSLPCHGIRLVKSGTDIISEGVISSLENEAKRVVEVNKKRQKRVKLQVKPHLLYRPMPKQGALVPDSTARYQLFDRVVNVREGFTVPFGLRGTVIGIFTAEVEVNTMYEVLFDEEFFGGISVRSSGTRCYRMPPSGLLNITHGERKNGVKPQIPVQAQGMQSNNYQGNQFSNNLQGNQYSNKQGNQYSNNFQENQFNRKSSGWTSYADLNKPGSQGTSDSSNYSGLLGRGNQDRNIHDNRGYSNQYKGSEPMMYDGVGGWTPANQDRNQPGQQSYGRGQHSSQSFGRGLQGIPNQQSYGRGHQNWNRGQLDNQSSQRQTEALAGQVFNGKGSGKPTFVTPKVNTGQAGKTSASQENTTVNSEFEDMWKVLKGDTSSSESKKKSGQGTALSKAAAVLPMVPSSASDNLNKNENNSKRDSTKIDVENLFTQASKAQGNDEFTAMFKSLELSNQEKLAAQDEETDEDGAIVIKKMLHIDSAEDQEALSDSAFGGGGKSYGKQVSIQELFDGAKQNLDTDTKGQEKQADVESKSQENPQPHQKQQNKQKKQQQQQQRQQSHRHQQQQQKRPNLLVQFGGGRNPVMELMNFCQSLQMGLPMYDYIPKNGMFYCVVSFITGARFQGSLCKTREEAAESSASVALLQMKGSMQEMAAQTMMRGGFMPGMMPQGRQFSSPNSAFSPVQGFNGQPQYPQPGRYPMFAQQPYRGGQKSQQYQRGSHKSQQSTNQETGHRSQQSANQDSSNRNQQQSNPGKTSSANENLPSKSEAPRLTNQNAANKPAASGSQSSEVKTCIVNPFVPLQVVKKQTPQKNRKGSVSDEKASKEESSADSLTKGEKSNDNLSGADNSARSPKSSAKSLTDKFESVVKTEDLTTIKTENVSKPTDKSVDKTDGKSASEKTPSKSAEKGPNPITPGKHRPRSRLAANFSLGSPNS